MILGKVGVVFFLFYSVFVTTFQVFAILINHPDKMRFGSNLILLDPLKCLLFFLQVKNAVLSYDFIYLVLLGFHFVVGTAVWLESALHILDDPCLRVQPVLRELFSVAFLGLTPLVHHVLLHSKAIRFFVVHFLDKSLSALQVLYAFICSLLLQAQLYDSILQLVLLVLLLLSCDDGIHHDIIRFLWSNTTHSWGEHLVLFSHLLGRLNLRLHVLHDNSVSWECNPF